MKDNSITLETLVSGIRGPKIIMIGSRPGMGKTFLSLIMAIRMAFNMGKSVTFFSLEMSNEALLRRISKISDLCPEDIQNSLLNIIDNPYLSFLELEQTIKNKYNEKKIEAVFIDYLGLLDYKNSCESQYKHQTQMIIKLKALANKLNIPIIILLALRRNSEGPFPQLVHSTISAAEAFQCIDQFLIFQISETKKNIIKAYVHNRNKNNSWTKEVLLWSYQDLLSS